MLQALRVKNLAIVESVHVELDRGLNAVTGETGAGKSILVGALGLVLGERADRTMIRAGEEKCGVEAVFELADSAAVDEILEELGIDSCEDGRLIVRRIISVSGTSRNTVNDCPTTVQVLKRIGDLLVDMHGPHDHQSLLNPSFQVDLLDAFGHLWKTRAHYEDCYRELARLERERTELESDGQDTAAEIDMLSFQVKEIKEAGLDELDEDELQQEHTRVANAQRILELAGQAINALTEGDGSAFEGAVQAQGSLRELAGILDEAETWRAEAESVAIQIQELAGTITGAVESVDGDPDRLRQLEDRMAMLHKLKRKYGGSVPAILERLEKAAERLTALETRGERLAEIDAGLEQARGQVQAEGRKLGKQRRKAAGALAEGITAALRDLGFGHGSFDVAVSGTDPGPSGADEVEFGFAPNAGEPMRSLRAIASSGEISRVMLAVKTVLAAHDRIPVLVFDEIDANVGGEMGSAIGAKLSVVAQSHQVLCITHLPQVAVHGCRHLVVVKDVQDGRTRTHIRPVEGDERCAEVARMLGGQDVREAQQLAREMLRKV